MSRSGMDTSVSESSTIEANDLEAELEPLAEDTLTRNLGLDLIVVVTKVRTNLIIFTSRQASLQLPREMSTS